MTTIHDPALSAAMSQFEGIVDPDGRIGRMREDVRLLEQYLSGGRALIFARQTCGDHGAVVWTKTTAPGGERWRLLFERADGLVSPLVVAHRSDLAAAFPNLPSLIRRIAWMIVEKSGDAVEEQPCER